MFTFSIFPSLSKIKVAFVFPHQSLGHSSLKVSRCQCFQPWIRIINKILDVTFHAKTGKTNAKNTKLFLNYATKCHKLLTILWRTSLSILQLKLINRPNLISDNLRIPTLLHFRVSNSRKAIFFWSFSDSNCFILNIITNEKFDNIIFHLHYLSKFRTAYFR